MGMALLQKLARLAPNSGMLIVEEVYLVLTPCSIIFLVFLDF